MCNHSFINPMLVSNVLYLGHDEHRAYEDDKVIYNKYFNKEAY